MIVLTIDTDWAPDHAVKAVLDKVRALGVKVTVFFSTPSPVEYWPNLEVGCHPDLSQRETSFAEEGPLAAASTEHSQAVALDEARLLADCRAAIPGAEAVRTHRFYWHSDLPRLLTRQGFQHDSSMIMPFHPGLLGFKTGKLYRWPCWSSDQLHLARKLPFDRLEMPHWRDRGLKIFCFHVTYLYLNTHSLADFNMVRAWLPEGAAPPRSGAPGVWDLFELLANETLKTGSTGRFLRELAPEWLA